MQSGSSVADLREFDGWAALSHALRFLSIHVVITLLAAAIFWLALLLTNERARWPTTAIGVVRFLFTEFAYVLAFATFGVVTAFFLSLGLKRAPSGESANGLIEGFAAPFISLLTAGAVFVTSRANAGGDKPSRIAICVACFLCSAAISYRTFFYQILTAF